MLRTAATLAHQLTLRALFRLASFKNPYGSPSTTQTRSASAPALPPRTSRRPTAPSRRNITPTRTPTLPRRRSSSRPSSTPSSKQSLRDVGRRGQAAAVRQRAGSELLALARLRQEPLRRVQRRHLQGQEPHLPRHLHFRLGQEAQGRQHHQRGRHRLR